MQLWAEPAQRIARVNETREEEETEEIISILLQILTVDDYG